jgi:hypothetical protein
MALTFNSFASFAAHLAGVASAQVATEEAALEQAAQLIETAAKDLITSGTGRPTWKGLATYTIADKYRKGFAIPYPLLRTGGMRDSISHRVKWPEAAVGSDDDIMVYQELGTSHIPPRSVLASQAADKANDVANIVGRAVFIALTSSEPTIRGTTRFYLGGALYGLPVVS